VRPFRVAYAAQVTDEEKIRQDMEQSLSNVIDKTLLQAALYDGLDEHEAVLTMAATMLCGDPPKLLLAARAAMVAIRWHRTQQTEAAVNSPAPGQ
jgi:hypothetical protein